MSNNKYLLLSSHIREAEDTLTKTERQIAEYILENPAGIAEATARSIGEKLGISPASVVRFCRKCGFAGLAELKQCIRRETAADAEPSVGSYTRVHAGDSVALVREKVLGYHNMIINDMMSGWNEQAYEDAAEAIAGAGRIVIFGEGGSRCTALCLFHILTSMGLPCENYSDPVFEIMKVGTLGPGDVAIGISYTGRLRDTVENLQLARERGATTIGFIGYLDSPMVDFVDILLNTTKVTKDYYDSAISIRVSENLAAEILTTLVAMKINRPIAPTIGKEHVVSRRRIWDGDNLHTDDG